MITTLLLSCLQTRCTALLTGPGALPSAVQDCWRPTIDDVDRISWGRPAKKKGTGSRGIPHRLNEDERVLYDLARGKGFVEIGGSGWRKQRSDSPLVNTYRSWCDARAVAAIFIHKGQAIDDVVLDISPLRCVERFDEAAAICLSQPGSEGGVLEVDVLDESTADAADDAEAAAEMSEVSRTTAALLSLANHYLTEPIHRLPRYTLVWSRPRPEAKALAKSLAALCGTAQSKGRPKKLGGPKVKAGKSRRHGGYGIG